MERIEAMLKEYESLRQESLDTINNRSQIVSFGLGTIGVLAAAIFSIDSEKRPLELTLLVFNFGIPCIAMLVLYVWLGEVERMMRAGKYLAQLEVRINEAFDPKIGTLQWEQWLRSSNTQMNYPYVVVLIMFFGLACAGPIVGVVASGKPVGELLWPLVLPWVGCIVVAVHVLNRTCGFK